jgi:isoamylase
MLRREAHRDSHVRTHRVARWLLRRSPWTSAMREVWPGSPYPLGVRLDAEGASFAISSEVATAVDLCLFDAAGNEERVRLPEHTGHTWHGYVPGITAGQRYGYRVHGPWEPDKGHRCCASKLLVDPYARAIDGDPQWDEALFDHHFDRPEEALNPADSGRFAAKSIVIDERFDWAGDVRPGTPWHDTIIYEAHVRGLTMRLREVPPELRGTYAGVAHPATIAHLVRLGITAIELMPIHHFVHDHHLLQRGLRNYWGYNSIGFFAPHDGYASRRGGEQVREVKEMVKSLHAAGIEVILDVVYNHTAEGNHLGPTLSFKGIDNASYYRLMPNARYYRDFTGTGNSPNMQNPHVLQLIMDSLRYWATEVRVDGFRFDLAATLARSLHEVDRLSSFFDLIQQDPVCRSVKLIAEPWDVGEGGYQVGNFPPLWTEWNGKYRDSVRDYWRGASGTMPELASRLTGSSDLYEVSGRRPHSSINFVTAHDGFTLEDLVSYDHKHNEANGEGNQDGTNDNRSWNCGVEGPSDDPEVLALRARQKRNLLTTLLLSQGVPMLLSGDELGRTQHGNNNAYAQDNDLSYLDWDRHDRAMVELVRGLIALRRAHPTFSRARFVRGTDARGDDADVRWLRPDGAEMDEADWQADWARAFAMFLNGHAIRGRGPRGERIVDHDFTLLFNAHDEPIAFDLAHCAAGEVVVDTGKGVEPFAPSPVDSIAPRMVEGRSMVVIRHSPRGVP